MSVLGQNFNFDSSRDPPHSGVYDRIQGMLSFWILWIWAKNWWRTFNSPYELHQEQITKRSTRYEEATVFRPSKEYAGMSLQEICSGWGQRCWEELKFFPSPELFSGPSLTGIIVFKWGHLCSKFHDGCLLFLGSSFPPLFISFYLHLYSFVEKWLFQNAND